MHMRYSVTNARHVINKQHASTDAMVLSLLRNCVLAWDIEDCPITRASIAALPLDVVYGLADAILVDMRHLRQ